MKSTEIFTLGHSPDPDDAFMFYAMAENKIDLRGYPRRGELHISAISIHAYPYVAKNYALLPCGASMGDGYGPVVVAQKRSTLNPQLSTSKADLLRERVIAVPGEMTSAFLALQLFLGKFDYVVVPFDKIFEAIKSGLSAKLFVKASITAWRIEMRRCVIRLPTRATWAASSPINSSACT